MEERKWEDLNTDCLVNIFGRLGLESLLLDVPLVCKPWYKTTLNPLCWQRLVFPLDIFESRLVQEYQVGGWFTAYGLIKFIVDRSQRSATLLVLPNECTREELIYVSDECPTLKFLALPSDVVFDQQLLIPGLIIKWKKLEMLRLGSSSNMVEILTQISLHCKNFVGLCVTRAHVNNETAAAIASLLPNLKYLILKNATLQKEGLVMILRGCKELVQLDVRNCIGFDQGDDEILKLASQIKNFQCEGSKAEESDSDDEFEGGSFYHDEQLDGDYC